MRVGWYVEGLRGILYTVFFLILFHRTQFMITEVTALKMSTSYYYLHLCQSFQQLFQLQTQKAFSNI